MTNRTTVDPTPTPTASPDATAVLASDRSDAAIVAIVREIPTIGRTALVAELAAMIPTDPTIGAILPVILASPFGPDPAIAIMDAVASRLDAVAALVNGALVNVGSFDVDPDDIVGLFADALTRIAPMDADAVAAIATPTPVPATTRSGRRPRRVVERDWDGMNGVAIATPGRPGISPASMFTVHVDPDGVPTFTTPDGVVHDYATNALRSADAWQDGERGWGNPFDVCRELRPTGSVARTLGAMTAVAD
jgi:hypothetical protein